MTDISETSLDADELLHLALRASGEGRSEAAIAYLKRALELAPQDARLHYLLGAEHAQIGLYDRATEEIQRAVTLDPSLDAAHFQLGLLHATSGRMDAAAEAWKALDRLGEKHPFYLFKTGLLHLARDEFEECETYLHKGIAANDINLPLNKDMARLLDDVRVRKTAAGTSPPPAPRNPSPPKSVALSAYRRNKPDDKEDA